MTKLKKIWSVFNKAIMYLLIAFIIVAATSSIFFTYTRSQNEMVNVFGYSFAYVLSGSMEPVLEVGDVILIKSVNAESIEVGDIITFRRLSGPLAGNFITHKVIEINSSNDSLSFTTKGIANPTNDAEPVTPEQIQGVYQRNLLFARYLLMVFSNFYIFFLVIVLPLLISLFMQLVNFIIAVKSDE